MIKKNRQVTLKDIAREAGVTPAAVSRALRDKYDIGDDTKEKVKEIAKRLGYQANILARNLRTGVSNVLGLLVPDNTNPYFARLIKGVEETAKRNGFIVTVINTNEDAETERNAISTLLSIHVGGILSVPVTINNFNDLGIPLIFLSRLPKEGDSNNFSYVINNDISGVFQAVSHLVDRTRSRIYFINGPRNFHPASIRLEGFKKALEKNNIEFNNKLVIYGDNSMEGGYNSFKKLLEIARPPFGLLCCSDFIAIGVLKSIREHGLKVPEDVSLVGYDDVELLDYLEPPLSTVKQARYSIGAQGAEIIIKMLEDSTRYKHKYEVVLEPELIIRKST